MLKRIICLSISIIMILYVSLGCDKKGISKIAITPIKQNSKYYGISWDESKIEPHVKPYTVGQDLSNISNIEQFPKLGAFDKYMLSKNLFMIKKSSKAIEQPFDIYQENESLGIPSFITLDSVLHLYHYMYDYIIRNIEKERLIEDLKEFTKEAFNQSLAIYNGVSDRNVKKAALKNIAYFGIPMKLLEMDLPGGIPLEASRMIDNDVKRIRIKWGSGTSEIFPYYIDYKAYNVRGHYSRENDLRNYFLAMTWYGNTPIMFETYDKNTGMYKRMDEEIVMAVIMVSGILCDENLRNAWDDLYSVTSTYFGKKGDIVLFDICDIIKVIYGEKINLNRIWDEEKIQKVYELSKQRYNLHIGETIGGKLSLPDADKKSEAQFRLMSQMDNIDSDIYVKLTDAKSGRTIPKGLDIPAAFGSDDAYTILKEQMNEDYTGYNKKMQALRSTLSSASNDDPLDYSLNNMIMWILKPYIKRNNEGYPSFMNSEYWNNKSLITYLGGITDMRHLSYMLSKQAEDKPSETHEAPDLPMPGYVEPVPDIYSRLEYGAHAMKSFLQGNDFKNTGIYDMLGSFADMASFLKSISIKELGNVPFTDEEGKRLKEYGRELEMLMLNAVESKGNTKDWEMIPQTDRSMASVVDAFQNENMMLQMAIGYPDYIYVVIPYMDKLYITRGSVYSYYEFTEPVSRKLDDKDWQNSVKEDKIEQPMWIKKVRY